MLLKGFNSIQEGANRYLNKTIKLENNITSLDSRSLFTELEEFFNHSDFYFPPKISIRLECLIYMRKITNNSYRYQQNLCGILSIIQCEIKLFQYMIHLLKEHASALIKKLLAKLIKISRPVTPKYIYKLTCKFYFNISFSCFLLIS